MTLTEQQLFQILPRAGANASRFVGPLNLAMARYAINTRLRIAAFIAEVGHESAQLCAVVENLNYSKAALQATWPTRFSVALAQQLANRPESIGNVAYASRMGNGPPESGDGWKFRGRGLFQITGKSNYSAIGKTLQLDLVAHPELLEQPEPAALSAGEFWTRNGLNPLADNGQLEAITRRINGGLNGQAERLALYRKALEVLA